MGLKKHEYIFWAFRKKIGVFFPHIYLHYVWQLV